MTTDRETPGGFPMPDDPFPVIKTAPDGSMMPPDVDMYARCADCGHVIDHIRFVWYPMPDDTSLCHLCGPKRGLTGIVPAEQG